MADRREIPGVPMQLSRGVLVASIQVDLDDAVLGRFRRELLERIHETSAKGVILDLSGIVVLDAAEFEALRRTVAMAAVMGARSVLVGLKPGIVSALMDTDVEVDGLMAALHLDDAFRLLEAPATEADDGENPPPQELPDATSDESTP